MENETDTKQEQNSKIPSAPKIMSLLFFFFGFFAICCFNATISNVGFISTLFGGDKYTIINLTGSIPNFIGGFIAPYLVMSFGYNILYIASIYQIFICIFSIFLKNIAKGIYTQEGDNVGTFILFIGYYFCSQLMFSIHTAVLLDISFKFTNMYNTPLSDIILAGMPASGIFVSLWSLLFDKILELQSWEQQLSRFSIVVLIYAFSIPAIYLVLKNLPKEQVQKEEANEGNNEEKSDAQTLTEAYLMAIKKQFPYILGIFAVFFSTFVVFPSGIFVLPNAGEMGFWFLLLFSFSELASRLLVVFAKGFLGKYLKDKILLSYSIIGMIINFILLALCLLYKTGNLELGIDAISAIVGALFCISGFNLGMLASTHIGILFHNSFKTSYEGVVASINTVTIAFSIFLGLLVSFAFFNHL